MKADCAQRVDKFLILFHYLITSDGRKTLTIDTSAIFCSRRKEIELENSFVFHDSVTWVRVTVKGRIASFPMWISADTVWTSIINVGGIRISFTFEFPFVKFYFICLI